jgi:CheY-like chemotaxis protein
MSEIDSGRFKIQTNAMDVKKFIDTVIEVHKYEAGIKGLEFSLEIGSSVPESIMIDEKRVKDILDNLLDNALKFTSTGSIKVIVSSENFDEAKHEADILFQVEDSGLGILKANQEKIFKVFENKEVNHKPEYQGTGLGLSINRKLAALMNGSLEVESELQEGATFTLMLKAVEIVLLSTNEKVEDSQIDFSMIKKGSVILVIDESQTTLDLIEDSLSNAEVDLYIYNSSKEGISTLQNKKVDLIIINITMLSMDDSAVAKVIRSVSKAPVVSLVDDSLKGISFHKNGVKPITHLKKPLQKVDLFRVILKVLNLQDMLIANGKIEQKKAYKGLSFAANELESEEYFKNLPSQMDDLLEQALSTKDLNIIARLAKGMYQLSLVYKVKSLTDFSKKLLNKVDNFEIEGIDIMLKEYERKSKEFKKRGV